MSGDRTPAVLEGRVVLVTGGSGFLGSTLVQRLLGYNVAEVRVLTRRPTTANESPPTGLRRQARIIVGALSDQAVLREAVRGANVVFHLAAIKSVEICETMPAEAINTNVHGTAALIRASLEQKTLERFIATSSDKASMPINVYGLTKAVMERMVAEAQALTGVDFGTVRCGSLWGSTGSVLVRWQEASRAGAELSITDPEMTRFVMLRSEAVDLMLEAASRNMEGGVLCRVMPAYVLGDLAALVSEMHGSRQRVVGGRPGEKLHEDLVSGGEAPFTEKTGEFYRITPGRRASGVEPFNSARARRLTQSELLALLNTSMVTPP